jgi:xanthine dehydrogenase YagS FAD-binding subunit
MSTGMRHIAIDDPKPFERVAPTDLDEAAALGARAESVFIAGGGDLLEQLKTRRLTPSTLVDLKGLPGLRGVQALDGVIAIGALTTLAAIARDPRLRALAPALCTAASRVATPQIRNTATLGGNLLQDSRCAYYREGWHCRRAGGRTCYAHEGLNGAHAIFGGGPCWTVTPSDLAPVLVALDAELSVQGTSGERRQPATDLFLDPMTDVQRMHVLEAGEILTHVRLPTVPGQRSHFVKVAVRGSWDFALASAAVAARVADGRFEACRIVLGGVAPTPWRCLHAEAVLKGGEPSADSIEAAAEAALVDAEPTHDSAYRVALVRQAVVDALTEIVQ